MTKLIINIDELENNNIYFQKLLYTFNQRLYLLQNENSDSYCQEHFCVFNKLFSHIGFFPWFMS